MDNFVFGRKRHKIQWRADLPIAITVICVAALFYGAVKLVSAYVRPEEEPVSTITVTKNTPSASELNLNAPLVDYNPNKDKEEEEDEDDEEDDEEDEEVEGEEEVGESEERQEEAQEEAPQENREEPSGLSGSEQAEVMGEQEEKKPSLGEIFSEVIKEEGESSEGAVE